MAALAAQNEAMSQPEPAPQGGLAGAGMGAARPRGGFRSDRPLGWLVPTLLSAYASILFARARPVGALLFCATLVAPRVALFGLLAALWALAVATVLGCERDSVRDGGYAISPILLGLGIGAWFGVGGLSFALLAVFVPLSVLVNAALRSLLAPARLPVLSLSFLLSFHLLLGFANAASLPYAELAAAASGPAALLARLPPSILLSLRSVGALFFIPHPLSGLLILLALAWHSRIATLLALLALGLCLGLRSLLLPLTDEALFHSLVYNAAFCAVALGGVWFVPSLSSFVLAALGVGLIGLFTVGLAAPLYRLGLPVSVLPFNATVLLVLLALRQRARDQQPKSVDFAAGTPEENLAYFRTRTARFRLPHPLRFCLPLRGAWTCTQGVDGLLTHQGLWRYAYDFEVLGPDGRRVHCRDVATLLTEYRAYRLPVLATAAGTVVAVESGRPDNPIGTVNVEHNWGNYVVLQHGPALYSLVAHLVPGSVTVAVGQTVRGGEVLGLCGNSGRSPEPHLHFQLQSRAELGSPTVPCHFSDCVLVSSRPDEPDQLLSAHEPKVDQVLRNLETDAERASFFVFPHGCRFEFHCDGESEAIESLLDLYGQLQFRSHTHAASLYYTADGQFFTAYDLTAPSESILHLIRAALSRVPCDASERLRWTDLLPARLFRGRLWGAVVDIASPFLPSDGIEVEYQARRRGADLLVSGTSRRRDRSGKPWIETEAELSRSRGILRLRLCLHGKERVALRSSSELDSERHAA
ncbi:MAG TPA: urea transporter [Pseudomonadota bacterium]|nr:urea transporter [Pseudomonadota bacterium]